MDKNRLEKHDKPLLLIVSMAIPLIIGGLSAVFTKNMEQAYWYMRKPPLAPPGWIFPVVWTLLYLMMGTACYFIFISGPSKERRNFLLLYAGQLLLNAVWTPLFFNLNNYLLAFVELIAMLVLLIWCCAEAFKVSRVSGLMMLPTVLWVTFAGYLNAAIFILSKTPGKMPR